MRIEEIEQAVPKWFEAGAMRFFRSRIHARTYTGMNGTYFVTSEKQEGFLSGRTYPRLYSVRLFTPGTDGISTVSWQGYRSASGAHRRASREAGFGPPVRKKEWLG
jgi:hypothetical protein